MDLLWRFHAVHHSVKRFYGSNGRMKHPIHPAIEMVVGAAPLVVVVLPPRVATAVALCTAIQLLLQHSNVDRPAPGDRRQPAPPRTLPRSARRLR